MKPSIPQGTRDFGADVVRKRRYIFTTLQQVFELFGFGPLETPAMENLDTLMGKYGEEGDKLMFKILNNGLDDPKKADKLQQGMAKIQAGKTAVEITERALRYDLTIPFARYVAMNHGQLAMPFKRYQMQPVWRADRPQRGRYREFYQCDADIVGTRSLLNEAELIQLYTLAFTRLGVPVDIRINNRKILAGLAETCGAPELLTDITVAIDKLDKIGLEKVQAELATRGISATAVDIITRYLQIQGPADSQISQMQQLLAASTVAQQGLQELEWLLSFAPPALDTSITLTPDFTLARGLNYYTGTILEVKARGVPMGSIGGGGRYDDLTGLFGVPNLPGVGISFGVDRIYDVMEELGLFPENTQCGPQALFFNLGTAESKAAFRALMTLRQRGIAAELYPEPSKFDKQFKYAEKKGIPYAIIIGQQELENGMAMIKHLASGHQEQVELEVLGKAWRPQ